MNAEQRVVVTAGGGGIGLAVAKMFAAHGDRVHICDINEQALTQITRDNAAISATVRCAQCGHIGCCDTSSAQHATAHAHASGHPFITSFEPGESWYYDYRDGQMFDGPRLPPPEHRPPDEPVPGPAGRVPADWQNHLH
jgi:nucleoside-diphosphate-sugar epimerase